MLQKVVFVYTYNEMWHEAERITSALIQNKTNIIWKCSSWCLLFSILFLWAVCIKAWNSAMQLNRFYNFKNSDKIYKKIKKNRLESCAWDAYSFPRMRCCLLAFGLVKIGKMHKTKLQFLALWCKKNINNNGTGRKKFWKSLQYGSQRSM